MLWLTIAPSLVVVANAAEYSAAASNTQLQPPSTWATQYAKAHRKHLPSPQQLGEDYRKQQRKKEKAAHKAEVAHEKFLKSPEYHMQMMRRAHKEFQELHRQGTSADNL